MKLLLLTSMLLVNIIATMAFNTCFEYYRGTVGGLYNCKTDFYVDPTTNVGTHMSLILLSTGKFVVFDTVNLTSDLQTEFDLITSGGAAVEAIVATHPFHTVFFPAWYAAYPNIPFYGTPRHLKIQPEIPWAGSVWDCAVRELWYPEIRMRIPSGAEFVNPETDNHFSGIHVFHQASGFLHVDDTLMIKGAGGQLLWHPTILSNGLYQCPPSPYAFAQWVKRYATAWNITGILAAHMPGGRLLPPSVGSERVQSLVASSSTLFDMLNFNMNFAPNQTQCEQWNQHEKHNSQCKEY